MNSVILNIGKLILWHLFPLEILKYIHKFFHNPSDKRWN